MLGKFVGKSHRLFKINVTKSPLKKYIKVKGKKKTKYVEFNILFLTGKKIQSEEYTGHNDDENKTLIYYLVNIINNFIEKTDRLLKYKDTPELFIEAAQKAKYKCNDFCQLIEENYFVVLLAFIREFNKIMFLTVNTTDMEMIQHSQMLIKFFTEILKEDFNNLLSIIQERINIFIKELIKTEWGQECTEYSDKLIEHINKEIERIK